VCGDTLAWLHYFKPHGSNLKLVLHVWQYKYPGLHRHSGSVYIELVTALCEANPGYWSLIQPSLSLEKLVEDATTHLTLTHWTGSCFGDFLLMFFFTSVSTETPLLPQGIRAKQSVTGKSFFRVQPLTYSLFFFSLFTLLTLSFLPHSTQYPHLDLLWTSSTISWAPRPIATTTLEIPWQPPFLEWPSMIITMATSSIRRMELRWGLWDQGIVQWKVRLLLWENRVHCVKASQNKYIPITLLVRTIKGCMLLWHIQI